MNYSMTRTLALAAASTLVLGGNAMAGIVTVVLSEELIVTNNDMRVACFEPELTTSQFPGPSLKNSLRFAFSVRPSGTVDSNIIGNTLPAFPSTPFQTPALLADLGLNQLNSWIDSSRIWSFPRYDASTGDLDPASIGQIGDDGEIDIRAIPDFGYGYVGYAKSDLSMFGYMQLQRLSLTQWRLVGYAYEDAGNPIKVIDLVPSAPTLVPLVAGLAVAGRRRPSGDHRA